MFSRKKRADENVIDIPEASADDGGEVAGLKPGLSEGTQMAKSEPSTQFSPEIPRRAAEVPGVARSTLGGMDTDDTKKLIVGREICLNGEITACEKLVVEGRVEANLSDSRVIDISTTGYFKGTAEVDEAVISGEFHGTLNVRGRLFVRSTGKVAGDLRYGELEIERGGRITGDVDEIASGQALAARHEAADEPETVAAEAD